MLHSIQEPAQDVFVLLVLLDKLLQQVLVLDHFPGVVRRDLVHGLLGGQLHPGPLVRRNLLLHIRLGLAGLHHIVPEGPVALRGQLLHPVGQLVAEQRPDRVGVVLLNLHRASLNVCVCHASGHGIHHLDPQPKLLGNGREGRGGVRVHALLHIAVVDQTGFGSFFGCVQGGVFLCHLCLLRRFPGLLQA